MSFKVNWKTHAKCFLISLILIGVLYNRVSAVLNDFITMDITPHFTGSYILDFYISMLIIMIPVCFIHEIIHAVVYKAFGGIVKIGFKGIYFYTMEVSGKPVSRLKFGLILIAPLIVISLLSLHGGAVGNIICLLNLAGSSGDIYMLYSISRYRRGCRIIDRSYGYDVI